MPEDGAAGGALPLRLIRRLVVRSGGAAPVFVKAEISKKLRFHFIEALALVEGVSPQLGSEMDKILISTVHYSANTAGGPSKKCSIHIKIGRCPWLAALTAV